MTWPRIDAHQHFWRYGPDYGWIDDRMAPLRRDFGPGELIQILAEHKIVATVAVQARQSIAETEFLLDLSDQFSFIRGVVGWVDLCSEVVRDTLRKLRTHPKLVGLRHVVQDEPDDRFLVREDFLRGVALLEPMGLAYDILIYPRQLDAAIEFVARFPRHRLVLDHGGKPDIRWGGRSAWEPKIRALARAQNLYCKLSGLVTEADWHRWTYDELVPYLDVLLESFGAGRLMFGSDWPVCTLAARYDEVLAMVERFISTLSDDEQQAILGGNAARFYRLPV